MNTEQSRVHVNAFIRSVYNWMAIGLALTGVVAYSVANTPAVASFIFKVPFVFMGLIIAELGFVFYLSARINKLQSSTATALFLIYAALNGATLSAIFMVYAQATIVNTFFICAATFAACSVYGMATKKDLTGMGNFMMMGLIGIIIASLVNFFVRSSAMAMIINYIGVLVFVGLTAYDTQKIKQMALTQPADLDGGTIRKGAIMGALSLYLDFVNMFLFMLRIFGGRD
jgi:hypothetical protein